MRGFDTRISLEEALAGVRRHLVEPDPATDVEDIVVERCVGRVVACEVEARYDVPGFDRAAMDGWALRGRDTFGASPSSPLRLPIVGEAMPAVPFAAFLPEGQAVRIMTGAPLPEGADAVLPAEEGREEGEILRAEGSVAPRRHVAARGEDLRGGDVFLETGRVLRPQDAGAAAAAGWARIPVWRRPAVRLLVTGDELVPAGAEPGPGRTVDANSVVLGALVDRDGGALIAARIPDDREALRAALVEAAGAGDLVLISGGSSVGREDHAPTLLDEEGEVVFHGVAMRPSSPSGFGRLGETPVFLLPGHPVSCLCAYDFFAGPWLRRRAGRRWPWPYAAASARVAAKIVSSLGRTDYVRVAVEDGEVRPLSTSGAGILSSTVRADGFVIVPEGLEGYGEGERVRVHLYDLPPGEGP